MQNIRLTVQFFKKCRYDKMMEYLFEINRVFQNISIYTMLLTISCTSLNEFENGVKKSLFTIYFSLSLKDNDNEMLKKQ